MEFIIYFISRTLFNQYIPARLVRLKESLLPSTDTSSLGAKAGEECAILKISLVQCRVGISRSAAE